jgi:hypothetical protein
MASRSQSHGKEATSHSFHWSNNGQRRKNQLNPRVAPEQQSFSISAGLGLAPTRSDTRMQIIGTLEVGTLSESF